MPILAGQAAPPQAPAGPPVAPRTTYTLTTGDGLVYRLSDYWGSGIVVQPGGSGLDAPTYQAYTDSSPTVDGHRVRAVRADEKTIVLPLYVRAGTRAEFVARKRALLASLSPRRGMASLEVAEPDGTRRRVTCYSLGDGLEGSQARDAAGRSWRKYVLTLRCPDPFWTGDPVVRTWRIPETGLTWLPVLPLQVGASQTLDNAILDNPGDQDGYPVWTLAGPLATGFRATLADTGEWWQLDRALALGEVATIDCHPHLLSATLADGTNLWPDITEGSTLWRVPYGEHQLQVQYGGATNDTAVTVSFDPRYESS